MLFLTLSHSNREFPLGSSRGGGFFHTKGAWGCAAHKGILFWTSNLAKVILVKVR